MLRRCEAMPLDVCSQCCYRSLSWSAERLVLVFFMLVVLSPLLSPRRWRSAARRRQSTPTRLPPASNITMSICSRCHHVPGTSCILM